MFFINIRIFLCYLGVGVYSDVFLIFFLGVDGDIFILFDFKKKNNCLVLFIVDKNL